MNFARCLFRVLDLDDQAVEWLAQQLDFDRALWVVDVPEDSLAAVAEAPNPKEARDLGTKQSKSCRPPGSMGGALDASHMRERRADAPAKRPEPVDALQVNDQVVIGDTYGGHGPAPLIRLAGSFSTADVNSMSSGR
jgi:hypothetical protein